MSEMGLLLLVNGIIMGIAFIGLLIHAYYQLFKD